MARVELGESRLRARKRRRRVFLIAGAFLCVGAVVGGAVWLSRASFLRIQTIQVSGAVAVATSTVSNSAEQTISGNFFYLFPKNNIFLYPKREIISSLLAENPILKNAEVHAQDFRTIAVAVLERQPKALWCPSGEIPPGQDSSCLFLDEDGVAYAAAPDFSSPVYVTYSGSLQGTVPPRKFLTSGQFRTLSALVDALAKTQKGDPIRHVAVDENGDVRTYFQNDFLLMFALSAEGGDVFERFSLALTAEPFKNRKLSDFEYLDLRFGDKLYYKLK